MIDKISPITDAREKMAAVERAMSRIRSASGTKRSFKMEIRLVQDVNLRRKYESRLAALDSQLKTLQADIKALEAETHRGDLFGTNPDDPEINEHDAVKAGDSMLKEASGLQDKTQDSLEKTKQMIVESKEVGVSTLEELERQRDVLYNIEREVDRVDDGLARAEALLKQFGKRMASDQFIQCFAVINCLLLCGVVIFAVIKKGGLTSGTHQPPSPVGN
jgi:SNARE protein